MLAQELDDVAGASCHLFDQRTGRDLAKYTMTNCKALDKRTALVMGMLFRPDAQARVEPPPRRPAARLRPRKPPLCAPRGRPVASGRGAR